MFHPEENGQEYDSSGPAELLDLVRLAAEICSTPMCLVTSLDGSLMHILTSVGTSLRSEDRSRSFCTHTVQETELLVVEDATLDPRFAHNPFVTPSDGIRFYAGVPISSESGIALGALCVVDYVPRALTAKQMDALKILGRQVQVRMELLTKNRQLEAALKVKVTLAQKLRNANRLFKAFLNAGPFVTYIKDADGRFVFYNDQLRERFGVKGDAWLGCADHEIWPQEVAQAFRAHDLEVLKGNRSVELDETSLAPDGSGTATPWKSYKFPFRNEDGSLMLAGLSVDVTTEVKRRLELEDSLRTQRRLAEELRSTEMAMQIFMNNTPHQCFIQNALGEYVFYNRSFARFFGIDGAAWLGQTDYQVLPHSVAQKQRLRDLDLLEDGQTYDTLNVYQLEDGTECKLRFSRFTYRSSGGQQLIAGLAVEVSPHESSEHLFSPSDTFATPLQPIRNRFRPAAFQEQKSPAQLLVSR